GRERELLRTAERNAALALEDLAARAAGRRARFSAEVLELQRVLGLSIPPYRLVCFDVSNLGPEGAVAAVVASENGRPRKALYRRMRMRRPGPDDFAMVGEAVERYLTRVESDELPRPDLVVVDGGAGQVSAARQAPTRAPPARMFPPLSRRAWPSTWPRARGPAGPEAPQGPARGAARDRGPGTRPPDRAASRGAPDRAPPEPEHARRLPARSRRLRRLRSPPPSVGMAPGFAGVPGCLLRLARAPRARGGHGEPAALRAARLPRLPGPERRAFRRPARRPAGPAPRAPAAARALRSRGGAAARPAAPRFAARAPRPRHARVGLRERAQGLRALRPRAPPDRPGRASAAGGRQGGQGAGSSVRAHRRARAAR